MIPGFVQLGIMAVLFQVSIVAGFYGYLKWRDPAPPAETRTRVKRILGSGIALIALGQLAVLGAVGSLRTTPILSLRESYLVTNAGVIVMFIGYSVIIAGFLLYSRTAS